MIGPEPVRSGQRRQPVVEVDGVRVVRCQDRREDGKDNQDREQSKGQPQHRIAAAAGRKGNAGHAFPPFSNRIRGSMAAQAMSVRRFAKTKMTVIIRIKHCMTGKSRL